MAENIEYIGVHYTAIQHVEKVYFLKLQSFKGNF